jgi:hypothetical protein
MHIDVPKLRIGGYRLLRTLQPFTACCGTLYYSEENADSTHFFRDRAALRAAATRTARPFVREAFLAAAFKEPAPRFRAVVLACRESERLEAALRPSRRNAVRTALDRRVDGLLRERLRLIAC